MILRVLASHWQVVWREVSHEDPSFSRISLVAMEINDWCQGETCMFHFAQETLGSLREESCFIHLPQCFSFGWHSVFVQ